MKMSPSTNRKALTQIYPELHALRGFAAIIVVSTHFLIAIPQYESNITLDSPLFPFLLKYSPLHFLIGGNGSVHLFFVLSGFVLCQSFLRNTNVGYASYAIRRIFRIVPVYWVAITAADIGAYVTRDMTVSDLSGWFKMASWPAVPNIDTLIRHYLLVVSFDTTALINVVWSLVHEMRI